MGVPGGEPPAVHSRCNIGIEEEIGVFVEFGRNTGPRPHAGDGVVLRVSLAKMSEAAFLLSIANPMFMPAREAACCHCLGDIRMQQQIGYFVKVVGDRRPPA
jgi:hypothetical protein